MKRPHFDKRARRIVDQNESRRRGRQRLKSVSDRSLPRCAAYNELNIDAFERALGEACVVLMNGHEKSRFMAELQEWFDGSPQDRSASQVRVLLGKRTASAVTASRRYDNDRYAVPTHGGDSAGMGLVRQALAVCCDAT